MNARLSVLILTLNEERNLPGALASLKGFCDDVVVLDSYSTDSTTQLARDWGARIVQRKFDNYATQRRAGLDLDYRYPWVMMLDADERIPEALWIEMEKAVSQADDHTSMFRMRRKDMFLGRWLRRASGYPTWFGRLVRRGMVRIEREINEEYIPLGRVGVLKEHLIHYPFNRGLSHWVDRHNSYSSMESVKACEERRSRLHVRNLLAGDPVVRRRAWKRLAFHLPMRPTLIFLYLYFFRLGLFDGRPGFIYCRLRAMYEMLIDAKRIEREWLERREVR